MDRAVDAYPLHGYSAFVITTVVLARAVTRSLRDLPQHVVVKLQDWVASVETLGLDQVRKTPGYHDEPLRGDREGQRSIRLSRAYRAFYTIEKNEVRIEFVRVFEVNKHDY